MTRRIVRSIIKLSAVALLTFLAIFFVDRNWRLLPSSIHEYMPQHHSGLVIIDITIKKCSALKPFSSCQINPDLWHRIDKDLYLGRSWFSHAYIHVRRKKEEELTADDTVVVDVSVGRLDPSLSTQGPHHKWEARPLGLWILRSSKRKAIDSKSTVTAVDALFGDDAAEARDGWQIVGMPLLLGAGTDTPSSHITVRRGSSREPRKPQLRVRDNGRFRIMQIGDLHLSTGVGICRDAIPDSYNGGPCMADPRTMDFVTKVLDEEKPDLVVLSGDQLNGPTAPDAQTAIFKYAQTLIKRKIPYVSIFGNHDDEQSLSRAGQMALVESLPYSLSKAGPVELAGVGNYYLEVLSRGGSDHSAITIYLLDTHAYSPDERNYPGYDWLKPNQIEWFRKTAAGLKKKNREFTLHHMDISFIHIPLPEYRQEGMWFRGEYREPVTAPWFNTHFHDALIEQGVVMVGCGHDHVNDYCGLSTNNGTMEPELWMCYAGGSGFGGYAGYGGYNRRVRLFDLDVNIGRITTWKRLEYGDIGSRIDEHVIVDTGHPLAPPPGSPPPPPPPPPE